MQTLLLPRSLYILALVFFFLLIITEWLFNFSILFPSPAWWILLGILFSFTMFFSIPRAFYNFQTLKALLHLPALIFKMLKALLRVKSKRTEFLHTPKTFTS